MNLAAMFAMFLFLIVLGVPIAYSIGGSAIGYLILKNPVFLLTMPQRIWSGTNSFIIIAMPLFMLAGELMNKGGLTRRLINFSMLLVKPFRGGLGEANVVASMIFGGISGSSVADTSALGSILIPAMVKEGYPLGFSAGITVASSTMGMIIPPSIPMLMYAMVSGASVGKLFLAGLIPGILVGGTQLVMTYIISRRNKYHPIHEKFSGRDVAGRIREGLPAVLMPVLIILSVSTGIATASESAGIAVLYSIMIIGGFSMVFSWILAVEQVPGMIVNLLVSSHISPAAVFLLLDILILLMGTFLDVTPCILLIAPILLPVMRQFGMNELQFGAVLIVGLAIGLVTPPVGMCLNVANKICGLSIVDIFKEALPFIICNVIVLVLVTFVPQVSLWLPSLLR